jgi:hypothetical protein
VEERYHRKRPPPHRPLVRRNTEVAELFILAIVLSAGFGGLVVLPRVDDQISRDSKLSALERSHAAGDRLGFDARKFDAFRARLRPRQHYSVEVLGRSKSQFINASTIRAYSAFYFLPAIQEPGAKPVFRYRFR